MAQLTARDLVEVPIYTLPEAAQYLRLPISTLRAWTLGQTYGDAARHRRFEAVIKIADSTRRRLSFLNVVEAFVLSAIRREHRIPLPKLRQAIKYLNREFPAKHPLADHQFETDGVSLFVRKYGQLLSVTQPGQLALEGIIRDHLKHIRRTPQGVPTKLYLFPHPGSGRDRKSSIVIDPRIAFGKPVLDGTGIRTSTLAERFKAGESIEDLAMDYGRPKETVEEAIRCYLRAA